VLQADGGTRCAAINAASLALINAGISMRDIACSCAAGCIDGTPLLDLNYLEDSAGGPDIPVSILPTTSKILSVQMDSKLALDKFEEVFNLAVEGCKAIHKIMKEEIEKYSLELLQSRELPPEEIPA